MGPDVRRDNRAVQVAAFGEQFAIVGEPPIRGNVEEIARRLQSLRYGLGQRRHGHRLVTLQQQPGQKLTPVAAADQRDLDRLHVGDCCKCLRNP